MVYIIILILLCIFGDIWYAWNTFRIYHSM